MDQRDTNIGASALRKASVRLIPLIAIAYGVAYTDRVNISFAALQMNRDLHFSASSYGLGAGAPRFVIFKGWGFRFLKLR